jgi:hypothetical protein
MVGATRNSVHGAGSNSPPFGQHEVIVLNNGASDETHENHERYQRDSVSRLSEGLEPLYINSQSRKLSTRA